MPATFVLHVAGITSRSLNIGAVNTRSSKFHTKTIIPKHPLYSINIGYSNISQEMIQKQPR